MAFWRESSDQPFTVIANQALQDENLSFEAIGLLAFMLSLPADWKYSRDWLMKQKPGFNEKTFQKCLKELKDKGYLGHINTQEER